MIKEKFDKIIECGFAKSIIELKMVLDRIISGKGIGSGIFTVKYQMLYLVESRGKTSPIELITELNMAKSNLALLAKKMIGEGLIVRKNIDGNKKQIYYEITDKGREELSVKMKAIDSLCMVDKEMLSHLAKTVQTLKKVK